MTKEWPFDARRMLDKRGNVIEPNPRQEWALDAFQTDAAIDLYISGGLGSGKTTTGAWALIEAMAWNAHITTSGKVHYAIVSSDAKQLQRVTFEAFKGAFNAATEHAGSFSTNPMVLKWSKLDQRVRFAFGGVLDYASGANGAQALEGGEYSVIWVDEPAMCREETQERVRERCRELIPGTIRGVLSTGTPRPGFSLAWLRQRFGDLEDGIVNGLGVLRVALPTKDNLANLPPGYADRLADMYSPEMAQAMLEGKFVTLGALVFGSYDDRNVVDYAYDPSREVRGFWDPAYRRPYFGVMQETSDGSGSWVVFDEVVMSDTSTPSLAADITERPWFMALTTVYHDPAGSAVQAAAGTSDEATMRRVFKDAGHEVAFSRPTHPEDRIITVGQERLRAMICSSSGKRRLFVARSLTERRYNTANDGGPVTGIHRGLSEQPRIKGKDDADRGRNFDHLSHACDATRYMAVCVNPIPRVDRESYNRAAEAARADARPVDALPFGDAL